MIVLRNKEFSIPVINLYHVTKTENIDGIKKFGLKVDKCRERKENELMGITQKAIYFVKNPNKLVKPVKNTKYSIIKLSIPKNIYDRMKKHDGNFVWDIIKDIPNEDDRIKYVFDIFKKAYPANYEKNYEGKSLEELKKLTTPLEYLAPDNTVLILEDIPPKYISNIKNYDEFIKNNSL